MLEKGEHEMILDRLIAEAAGQVRHRLWVISDLQQQYPERATHCMVRAVEDFLSRRMPCEAVCDLGDAVEGHNPDFLLEMAEMQVRELAKVGAPVYYILGNHDFDYYAFHRERLTHVSLPFWEHVCQTPGWRTQGDVRDLFFMADMGDYALCFLPDHADPAGHWYTTHGEVRGDAACYPYALADYEEAMRTVCALRKPVYTLSHYAFAGGNRAAPLFDRFLPLPENVRMHFYGHAHVGDAVWAGKDCHRKIAAVDHQPVMQINVASLENYRGSAIRSVVLEIYEGGETGVLFRNHSLRCWDDALVVRPGDGWRIQEK